MSTIIYAPLVVDWSGAKLSKSLYVKQNAYKNLPQYLVNYDKFREKLGEEGVRKMFDEVSSWLEDFVESLDFSNFDMLYDGAGHSPKT